MLSKYLSQYKMNIDPQTYYTIYNMIEYDHNKKMILNILVVKTNEKFFLIEKKDYKKLKYKINTIFHRFYLKIYNNFYIWFESDIIALQNFDNLNYIFTIPAFKSFNSYELYNKQEFFQEIKVSNNFILSNIDLIYDCYILLMQLVLPHIFLNELRAGNIISS